MGLLFDSHLLVVNPDLAAEIGLEDAIVLQQIHYWVVKGTKTYVDGMYWVYNTYEDWTAQFPFLSERQIQRTITRLRNANFIFVRQLNKLNHDRTNYYTVNYDSDLFNPRRRLKRASIKPRSAPLSTPRMAATQEPVRPASMVPELDSSMVPELDSSMVPELDSSMVPKLALSLTETTTKTNSEITTKINLSSDSDESTERELDLFDEENESSGQQEKPKKPKQPKKLNIEFDVFWDGYDKKVGSKAKLAKKWGALTNKDREAIIKALPAYVASTPDKKYRKNPETYLNNKSWLDEIIPPTAGYDARSVPRAKSHQPNGETIEERVKRRAAERAAMQGKDVTLAPRLSLVHTEASL